MYRKDTLVWTAFASPRARGSCHRGSRHRPRFAVPAQCQVHHGECHDNVYHPKQTLSPEDRLCRYCLFLNAINALLRLPSPEWILASRCDWVYSCDWIFIPKFFGCPTHRWSTLFALSMDHRTTKTLLWQYGFFIVGEKQIHCCSISIAPECAWYLVCCHSRCW